jgi:GAF domain-containing protein
MSVALPQLVPAAADPRPSAFGQSPSTGSNTAAMLQTEREKVRRLMHSLRDARVALKSEREARRRFETLYLDLKARAAVADASALSQPRPVSELVLDMPSGTSGWRSDERLALNPADAGSTVDKLVQMLDSAQSVHTESMLNDVLTRVMQRSRNLVGATRCTLYVANHSAKEMWSLVTDLQSDRLPGELSPTASVRVVESTALRFPMGAGLAGWCASTGQAVRVPDLYKDSRFHTEIDQQNPGSFTSTSSLCVPLFADGDKVPFAVMQMLNKVGADQFEQGDEEMLRTIAAHCYPAVQKCSLFVQLGKLLNSTKQLMTVVDMEKMIVAIMQRTGELLDCEHCCLFVVEETTGTLWSLRPRAESSGVHASRTKKYERVAFKLGQGVAGHVAATGLPVCYPAVDGEAELDVSIDEQLIGQPVKQALCQPILGNNGHVLGVMMCANKFHTPEAQFHEQDTELLRSLCQKASTSMEKCRLFIRLRSLMEGTQELNSERNLKTLIGSITVRAKELLNAERCTLFLLDNSGTELWSYVTDGTVIRVPLGQGIAGTVASTGEPFIVKDAYLDPVFDASVDKKTGFRTRAVMCYPITGEAGHVMGVLQMINKNEKVDEAAFFNEEDEELLHALCSHVGVTLTNSKLFDKINVLLKTASSLNSNKDTATLIGDMMGHARDLLECERATVFLVDEEKKQIYDQVGLQGLEQHEQGGAAGGFPGGMDDPFSMFEGLFGGGGGGGGFGGGGRGERQQQQRQRQQTFELNCTLNDAFKGKKYRVQFDRNAPCATCTGSGVQEGHTRESA